jgi:putative Holliday junction resolvase
VNHFVKRILAIDFGEKRIGIALSDSLQITAQPFVTWENLTRKETLERLQSVLSEHDVGRIILGIPLTLRGERKTLALRVENFHRFLSACLDVPVILWDERFTSVQAHRAMAAMGEKPSRNKAKVDQIAASLLLQNYLDASHGNPMIQEETS